MAKKKATTRRAKAGGDLPRMHPRGAAVDAARREIGAAVLDVVRKHGLTPTETFRTLNQVQGNYAIYALRMERHGTARKSADVHPDDA